MFRADHSAKEEDIPSQLISEAHAISGNFSTAADKSEIEEMIAPAPKKDRSADFKQVLKE